MKRATAFGLISDNCSDRFCLFGTYSVLLRVNLGCFVKVFLSSDPLVTEGKVLAAVIDDV